jgi:hypothetical protein
MYPVQKQHTGRQQAGSTQAACRQAAAHPVNACKQLLEVCLDHPKAGGLAQHLQQVIVTQEIKPATYYRHSLFVESFNTQWVAVVVPERCGRSSSPRKVYLQDKDMNFHMLLFW